MPFGDLMKNGVVVKEGVILFSQAVKDNSAKEGAYIYAIYYCPREPEAKIQTYSRGCNFGKAKSRMLTRAKRELKVHLNHSFMLVIS